MRVGYRLGEAAQRFYIDLARVEQKSDNSIAQLKGNISRVVAYLGEDFLVKDWDVQVARDALGHLNEGVRKKPGPATRRTQRYAIAKFTSFLETEGVINALQEQTIRKRLSEIARSKANAVEPPLKQRVPREKFAALVDAAKDPTERIALVLGLRTLLRSVDIAGLQWGNVYLDETPPSVTATISKKGDKARTLPLDVVAVRELRAYKEWYANDIAEEYGPIRPDYYVIPRRKHNDMDNSGTNSGHRGGKAIRRTSNYLIPNRKYVDGKQLTKWAQEALEAIGIQTWDRETGEPLGEGMHTLRRSAASAMSRYLANTGKANHMRLTQTMLTHEDIKTTQLYVGRQEGVEDLFDAVTDLPYGLFGPEPEELENVIRLDQRKVSGDGGSDEAH